MHALLALPACVPDPPVLKTPTCILSQGEEGEAAQAGKEREERKEGEATQAGQEGEWAHRTEKQGPWGWAGWHLRRQLNGVGGVLAGL